ncbi:RNA polymerase sigma factor [Marinicella sp. W31]|uniref:RNA polymerase sigma factor n=1 Tax=Marinicella sp. W31 TaxID=3023713 RepID=UPI003756B00F
MGIKKNNSLIENWYTKFDCQLTRFFGKAVSTQTDLQDLSQEVYLRMLRVKNPEQIHSPRAYLYRVAIHVLDEWRSSHREQYTHVSDDFERLVDDDAQKKKTPADPQLEALKEALETLPEVYARTLVMKWHYGMTYEEIAEKLDISQRQVKRYIVKGYAELRVKLANKMVNSDG